MANDRLKIAILESGQTISSLSAAIGVDPKTIERWISTGRIPHRSNRLAAVRVLERDEVFLWPDVLSERRIQAATVAEVIGHYPNRGSVPSETWQQLIHGSERQIDILAFAASFLHDTMPNFQSLIRDRAAAGVSVRLLFGDPKSPAVRIRGREEDIGGSLAERCRLTWKYLRPLLETPGVEAREHGCTLYASLFRFDDDLLANNHLFGAAANHSPITHYHRVQGGQLFDVHLASFERVWDLSQPVAFLKPA